MEVVYGVKDNGWLVKLLRGMISGPGAGDKQKKVRQQNGTATEQSYNSRVPSAEVRMSETT